MIIDFSPDSLFEKKFVAVERENSWGPCPFSIFSISIEETGDVGLRGLISG